MPATRTFVAVVAVFALVLGSFACRGRSQHEIIESFIDEAPPVDLTDREVVERVAYHSQPDWVILESLVGLAFFLDLEENPECPTIIDNSDPEAGITDVEYRGDGCQRQDNGQTITIDGSLRLKGDEASTTVEYDGLVLTSRDEQSMCADVPYDAKLSFLGMVSLPPDAGAVDVAVAGDYQVLVKHDLMLYTDECQLVRLTVAHDQQIRFDTMDPTHEPMIVNQSGRTAVENHGFTDPEVDFELPEGSYSVERTDLRFEPSVCTEPTGGSITLSAGGDTAVIEPDGAVDCDSAHCAPWSLNGEAQAEPVCGIEGAAGCQAGARGQYGMGALLLLALGSLCVRPRRRRRPSGAVEP